jgi:thioredoxin-like negative regulator of GroEL
MMSQWTRREAMVATLSLCLGSGAQVIAGGAENKTIAWQPSLKTAHRLAIQQNKPIMVVFGAEWCTYCKKLEKNTLSNTQLSKYINSGFISVHIDVDEQERVAQILEVKSLPCTIVLSPSADLLGRIEGFQAPNAMYQKLAEAQNLHVTTTTEQVSATR